MPWLMCSVEHVLGLRCEDEDASACDSAPDLHVQQIGEETRLLPFLSVISRRPHRPRCPKIRSLYQMAGFGLPGGLIAVLLCGVCRFFGQLGF